MRSDVRFLFGVLSSLPSTPITLQTTVQRSTPLVRCVAPSSITADVIVIGGGHAGCEAAAAAARIGASTILVTQRSDTIGEMSCNPSIGGIGKGHLVREVDALDGLMGRVIDEAGIHFRMLNRRKGPAVQGPRAQADRDLYRAAMLDAVLSCEGLHVHEASVEDIIVERSGGKARVSGIVTADGERLFAPRVVVTTGTFLRGVVHIGRSSRPAGRYLRDSEGIEPPCTALAKTFTALGLPLDRLKTGTPARLDGESIAYEALESQPSDEHPVPFSYLNEGRRVANADRFVTCHKTYTTERTHEIVRANAALLPEYESGDGKGAGPRYCPSLFAKVERFPQRMSHMVWLEPEGLDTTLVYPNGISSAFPVDVQQQIIESIPGLEHTRIVQPAYDVEYDYVDPKCLTHALEVRQCAGLHLAGQIIGTTGYEEAAALGTVAGANAALGALGREPLVIGRDQGYIGVLVDDLVTRGTQEPYRMFTSRAEYRLLLRADNADSRLTELGYRAGIVGEARHEVLQRKESAIDQGMRSLQSFALTNAEWAGLGLQVKPNGDKRTAEAVLSVPNAELEVIEKAMVECAHGWKQDTRPTDGSAPIPPLGRESVEIRVKYAKYLERQEKEVERMHAHADRHIPPTFDFAALPCLSNEEVEKLSASRPATLREASDIPGITPKAVLYLYTHLTKKRRPGRGGGEQGAAAADHQFDHPLRA